MVNGKESACQLRVQAFFPHPARSHMRGATKPENHDYQAFLLTHARDPDSTVFYFGPRLILHQSFPDLVSFSFWIFIQVFRYLYFLNDHYKHKTVIWDKLSSIQPWIYAFLSGFYFLLKFLPFSWEWKLNMSEKSIFNRILTHQLEILKRKRGQSCLAKERSTELKDFQSLISVLKNFLELDATLRSKYN